MQLKWWHKENWELWILRREAWGQSWISLRFVNKTKSLVAETEGLTVMITRRMLNRFHQVPSDAISFPETSFIVSLLFPFLSFKYLLPHEVYLQKFFTISLFPHGQSFFCNLSLSIVKIKWFVPTKTCILYNVCNENVKILCTKYFILRINGTFIQSRPPVFEIYVYHLNFNKSDPIKGVLTFKISFKVPTAVNVKIIIF